MGLLEEMFAKKKETSRSRTVKVTPVKKDPEKTSQRIENKSLTPSSFFGSLKRVQGAVASSTSKTATPKRNDVTKSKPTSEVKNKPSEKDKDKRPWYKSPPKTVIKKDSIKSSTASLNVGSNVQKSAVDPKKKRPVTVFTSSNVTYRR
ncbi:hypothetical protein JTB14_006052 [Gonioctena quinquepunctata]|nr:hypothetical protein JTB14_006052 [Gonioctena quinquepunctata]